MDEPTQRRFEAAVERKKDESRGRSHEHRPVGVPAGADPGGVEGDQGTLIEDNRTQDVRSPRDKNSGKGKKTADKWNQ